MGNECWPIIPEARDIPEDGLERSVAGGGRGEAQVTEKYEGDEPQQFTFLDYDAICACAVGCMRLGAALKAMATDRKTLAEEYLDEWYGLHRADYEQLSEKQAGDLETIADELTTFGLDIKTWAGKNLSVDMDVDELFRRYGE